MSDRAHLTESLARRISYLPNLAYSRVLALPRLLPLRECQIADGSVEGRLHLVRLLRRALRIERERARDWSPDYDANRHALLLRACRYEEGALLAAIREECTALSTRRARLPAR